MPRSDDIFHELRTNYGAFLLAMYPKYEYEYFQQKIIAPALNEVVRKNPEYSHLDFFMPFRHGKSMGITVPFPAFYLGHHPEHTVMVIGYNARHAWRLGQKTRDLMETPLYEQVFPDATLRRDSRARDDFTTKLGGRYLTGGFDGTINGSGADLILIDDPIKSPQEATSEATEAYQRALYTSIIDTRLEPGGTIMFVTTRWTPSDLAGWRIAEDGGWDAIRNRPWSDELALADADEARAN